MTGQSGRSFPHLAYCTCGARSDSDDLSPDCTGSDPDKPTRTGSHTKGVFQNEPPSYYKKYDYYLCIHPSHAITSHITNLSNPFTCSHIVHVHITNTPVYTYHNLNTTRHDPFTKGAATPSSPRNSGRFVLLTWVVMTKNFAIKGELSLPLKQRRPNQDPGLFASRSATVGPPLDASAQQHPMFFGVQAALRLRSA